MRCNRATTLTLLAALLFVPLAALHAAGAAVAGQLPPGAVDFDLQGFVDARLKAAERRVVVPPGRYRVTPKNGVQVQWMQATDPQGTNGVPRQFLRIKILPVP